MEPKTFVVPLDGSETAEHGVSVAAALARRIGGRLLLVTAEFTGPVAARDYLEGVSHREFGCPVEWEFVEGRYPTTALLAVLDGHDDRVVCMTTHGRGRVAWATLGSVAEDVLRRLGRPVVLVGPHCRPEFITHPARMMIATAGEPWSADIVTGVQDWAALLQLEPRVVSIAHPLDVETTEHPEHLADALATRFGVDRAEVMLVHADVPGSALVRTAEELPASIIVMGTHARHGLSRVALGSVTMDVVRHVSCPVLAIPPVAE